MALLARRQPGGLRVVGTDLTPAMLYQAQAKAGNEALPWVVSDGLRLSFEDNAFDAVTSAFMMRNVPDVVQALREQTRVVRPGGHVVCLEMTWPRRFPMSRLFHLYFFAVPPLLGWLMTGTRKPYRYLPRSVERFLEPAALAGRMEEAGLRDVTWQSMMMGTVVLHTGVKPRGSAGCPSRL
jgi:demethylmenaquinone methyltransferase/2-methoxy-6-polyprenyl-1,4-benzoquinol methylase